jgi:IclR family acetate operon transcriptional repressor
MAERDSNIIQSLSRGLAALELIAQHSITPKELGDELSIDRSSAYRILCTLAAHGFVERDPLSEQYIINGRKIFAMSSVIGANIHWPSQATPWLRQLRDETGEAVNIAVLQGQEVVYVNHLPSLEAITVGPLLGLRRPVYSSAVGKAIIAFLPDNEREALIKPLQLKALSPKTIIGLDLLRRNLDEVVQLGYAVDDEETFIGIRCVAAPIRDHSNQVIAALGLSGPTTRINGDRITVLGQLVSTLAVEFSSSLGAHPEPSLNTSSAPQDSAKS